MPGGRPRIYTPEVARERKRMQTLQRETMARGSHPTAERVRELFDYDPETGILTNKIRRGKIRQGAVAGCLNKTLGYWMVMVDSGRHYNHRIIWLWMTGEWPKHGIDHVDLNKDNNNWANLRLATQSQNMKNIPISSRNKSGVKGIHWAAHCRKWCAQISVNGRINHIGIFESIDDARGALDEARERFHGEFGRAA